MERKRKRLLSFFAVAILLSPAVVFIHFYLNILVVTLVLLIPIGLYLTYLVYRIQQFRSTFKPHVVNLILDFIDDGLNFGTLKYDSKRFIEKERFIASQLFASKAPFYQGEDFIGGKIGELDFEMCELNVKEYSKVRNRLNYVFRGIFLHTTFNQPLKGKIIVLPREFKQYLLNLKGKIFLTFEETTTSSWLYTELDGLVTRIIVCDPYRNHLLSEGAKTDKIDACKLVKLLRGNLLKEVFHANNELVHLRKIVSGYRDVIISGVRLKNQRSALFRAFNKKHRDEVET